MNITTYEKQFQAILSGELTDPPYHDEFYLNYVKLNSSRFKRWYKVGKILPELQAVIKSINEPQEWLLITEPWCGDAAHAQPFIAMMAELNPLVTLVIQNRDAAGSEIEKNLTNGGKSIPKLIIRNEKGQDLFSWGPRPKPAQAIHLRHSKDQHISTDEKKIELQNWYNKDKGITMQEELHSLFQYHIEPA